MLRSHSPSLYLLGECISAAQKAIRRGLVQDALFWVSQVVKGGYGNYLISRLLLGISCEDIGFGWANAPVMVVQKWKAWQAELKKNKCGIRQAATCAPANDHLLELVAILASAGKSRMMATCAGVANSEPYAGQIPNKSEISGWKGLGQEVAQACWGADAVEKKAVTMAHWLFLALSNVTDKKQRSSLAMGYFWKPMEAGLRKSMEVNKCPKESLDLFLALREIEQRGIGSPRLAWFEAVLLPFYATRANWKTPVLTEEAKKSIQWAKEKVLACPDPLAARMLAVPSWALDKHTMRGRGQDTAKMLWKAAKSMGVTEKVKAWDAQEIGKSHDPARVLNTEETKKIAPMETDEHSQTQLEKFFLEGALVDAKNLWHVTDLYETPCMNHYVSEEKKHGFKKTKAKFMMERTWGKLGKLFIAEWSLDPKLFEPKEKKPKEKKPKESKKGKKRQVRDGDAQPSANKRVKTI